MGAKQEAGEARVEDVKEEHYYDALSTFLRIDQSAI